MVQQHIEAGWNAYRRNFAAIVGATILAALMPIAILLASAVPFVLAVLASPFLSSYVQQDITATIAMTGASAILLYIGIAIAALTSMALNAGIVRVYADSLAGKARLEALFSTARQKFLTAVGAAILSGLVTISPIVITLLFGFISPLLAAFLLIPALILILVLNVLLMFTSQAIVIDGAGAVGAVRRSMRAAGHAFWSVLLLLLIWAAAAIIVMLALALAGLLVLWLLISPVFGIALTSLYAGRRRRRKASR
jgi:hypothetical protein